MQGAVYKTVLNIKGKREERQGRGVAGRSKELIGTKESEKLTQKMG